MKKSINRTRRISKKLRGGEPTIITEERNMTLAEIRAQVEKLNKKSREVRFANENKIRTFSPNKERSGIKSMFSRKQKSPKNA